ncbi:MAG: hypothetical protein P4L95_10410 [Rouxiella aceris]|uniref:hypothetical protein n=1 Tax=Rouxiella aceris TaxID=2703884 RepID=UPI00284BA14C|nr:hypothetical protein [Rouxiella aceris]MDR3432292.1 hypothetical protein [Rouxiella aceris]
MKLIGSVFIILFFSSLLTACHRVNNKCRLGTGNNTYQETAQDMRQHCGTLSMADSFHHQAHHISNYIKHRYKQQYKNDKSKNHNNLPGNEFTYPGINFGDMLSQ